MTKTTANTPAADRNTRTTKHLRHAFNPTEANWSALSFPTDPHGLTTKLRREFRDTIQRCRGSDEKFRQVLDNLEVLMAWAEAKIAGDKAANEQQADLAATRAAELARREEFRSRIQAGVTIRVTATETGFIEQSPRTGEILAVYDTADDEAGAVPSMARMMLAEGRDPVSVLEIDAFGRPGIGSGQTLGELAGHATGTTAPGQSSGGLLGIRV